MISFPIEPRKLHLTLSFFLIACVAGLGGGVMNAGESPSQETLKPGVFIPNWLVLKVVPVDGSTPSEQEQLASFGRDWLESLGGEAKAAPYAGQKLKVQDREVAWATVRSPTDQVVLATASASNDFAIAYAWAECDSPEPTKGLLGIGSDDAVKVWVNGRLAHENWTDRPSKTDDDVVPVEFQRGKNHLLLKIQNKQGEWGFVCRLLDRQAQGDKITTAVWSGTDADEIEKWLAGGMDINAPGQHGLTAWQMARLRGSYPLADLLASRGAVTNVGPPKPEIFADWMLSRLATNNGAGLSVLVAQNGKVLFEKAYGAADIDGGVPASIQTKFRIGSITKQFTAAAILKLQEDGKLSVQDKLSKFIPDFPRGDEVTIHHLLTHTSGIHSYTGKPEFLQRVTKPIETKDLIAWFKQDPYDFNPGERMLYNNSGFFLLGFIIEKVSGMGYGDYLRKTFFEPLGMKDTGVHRGGLTLKNEATGYEWASNAYKKALNWDMSWAGGAGALYSTVGDLFRWNEGIFSGKALKADTLKLAITPVKTRQDKDEQSQSGYGYGWALAELRGRREISHGGGLNGFSSFLLRVPEENFTVAALRNALPASVDSSWVAHQLAEVFLAPKLQPLPLARVAKNVTPEALQAVVGRYDYGGPILTVTREGTHIYAQMTGQSRLEIYPRSDTEFFWKVVDAQVTFIKDATGKITRAVHRQGGQNINVSRLPDIAGASVNPVALEPLLGKYDYGQGQAVLTVTREGDRLFAQLSGQPKFEIFPKSETEFFWKVVDAGITFVKGAQGKVIKAIHHQGGRDMEVPKID